MVPVWFHVVPTMFELPEILVLPGPDAYLACGSGVVPCGSMGAAAQEAAIPCKASLQITWFLRGSMWFLQRRMLLPPSRSHASPVVPVWFRVVPCGSIGAAAQEATIPCAAALQFTWFLCGSMWFLQRQSLLPPSRSNGIWRGPAENMRPQTHECMRLHHQKPLKKLFLK